MIAMKKIILPFLLVLPLGSCEAISGAFTTTDPTTQESYVDPDKVGDAAGTLVSTVTGNTAIGGLVGVGVAAAVGLFLKKKKALTPPAA